MTSFRQFEANRRNALRSTGPKTEEGKRRSRLNAVRHGLTAETVVRHLEDAEDYKTFEATIIADYCAETAVGRELVLRLASLLWRLRRATAIETDLFEIQAEALAEWQSGDAICTKRGSENSVARPVSAPSARALLRPIIFTCARVKFGNEPEHEFPAADVGSHPGGGRTGGLRHCCCSCRSGAGSADRRMGARRH